MGNNFGERLNYAIKIKGKTQADIIKKTGISKGALSSYIKGRYEPKHTNIYKLSRALDVSPAWLMGFNVDMDDYVLGSDFNLLIDKEHEMKKEDFVRLNNYLANLTEDKLKKVIEYIEFLESKKH